MAILDKGKAGKPQINLSGSGGNAFALLGEARALSRQLGKDAVAISKEMTSGDYEHLLEVFDREFGEYVDLVR